MSDSIWRRRSCSDPDWLYREQFENLTSHEDSYSNACYYKDHSRRCVLQHASTVEHDEIRNVSRVTQSSLIRWTWRNIDGVDCRRGPTEDNSHRNELDIATITGITLPHSTPAIFGAGKLINTNHLINLEMRRGNISLIRFYPFEFCEWRFP